jgi:glucose-1-phosphate cytidylyltransferase
MEKPQLVNSYINGGFFVFNRPFLECLTEDETCDLEFGALQELAHNNELRVFRHEGFWQCMDNVRERDYLNELYREGKAPWMKDRDGMPA